MSESKSYAKHVEKYTTGFTRDPITGKQERVLMSLEQVEAMRRKEQEAKDLATAIAKRRAAAIAAKSDRRSDLEKKRDGFAAHVEEVRQQAMSAMGSERANLQSRLHALEGTLNKMNVQVDAERKEREWAASPDIARMLEHSSTLRSIRVAYDALPDSEEVNAKIMLAQAISESRDFHSTRDQHDAYFEVISELSDLNLSAHRQRTAEAEERRLAADRDFARQALAEKQAEGMANGR